MAAYHVAVDNGSSFLSHLCDQQHRDQYHLLFTSATPAHACPVYVFMSIDKEYTFH